MLSGEFPGAADAEPQCGRGGDRDSRRRPFSRVAVVERSGFENAQRAARDDRWAGIGIGAAERHLARVHQSEAAVAADLGNTARTTHRGADQEVCIRGNPSVSVQRDGAAPTVTEAVVGVDLTTIQNQGGRTVDMLKGKHSAFVERDRPGAKPLVRNIHADAATVDRGAAAKSILGVVEPQRAFAVLDQAPSAGDQAGKHHLSVPDAHVHGHIAGKFDWHSNRCHNGQGLADARRVGGTVGREGQALAFNLYGWTREVQLIDYEILMQIVGQGIIARLVKVENIVTLAARLRRPARR